MTDNAPTPAAENEETAPPAAPGPFRERWQIVVTIALLLVFGGLVGYLMVTAHGTDEIVWQRRVFVFGGVEALVFTALGWLFGREVSRSAVAAAQQDAADAKKEAETARTEAQQQSDAAAQAKVEATEERTRGETAAAVVANTVPAGGPGAARSGSREAGLGSPPQAASGAATVDLQALFRRLYPERPSSNG